jgi:hypothetical protein
MVEQICKLALITIVITFVVGVICLLTGDNTLAELWERLIEFVQSFGCDACSA